MWNKILFLWGLFLKVLYKLKLGKFFYPILCVILKHLPHVILPNIEKSKLIILNNKINKRETLKYNNLIYNNISSASYDLQIIIPVYNAEHYLKDCLNSVLSQDTCYSFQLLIVNDGSTDNSKKILNYYNKRYKQVKIINQKNLGRSAARDKALAYASSKYVMFVDADDKLPEATIQNLLNCAYKNHSDIAFGGYYQFNDNHVIQKVTYPNNNNLHLKSYYTPINDFVWGKVFKLQLFKRIRFPINYEFEDTILPFLIYPCCKKISSINSITYKYRYNPKGISHTFQFTKISIDSFLITCLIVKLLYRYDIPINQYVYNMFLKQVKTNCMRNIFLNTDIQKSIFVLTCYLMNKYFSKCRTNIDYFRPLEQSIRCRDYYLYILFCIMK